MPSKSPKQARTMRAAAHDPAFAKKLKIPQKVAKEFVAADQGEIQEGEEMTKAPKRGTTLPPGKAAPSIKKWHKEIVKPIPKARPGDEADYIPKTGEGTHMWRLPNRRIK